MTITSASHRTSGRSRPPGTQDAREVPDPYYGGSEGFEIVLDILEDACKGLLEKIKDDIKYNHQE